MKLRFAALLAILLGPASASAQAPTPAARTPSLLIAISVDQFSAALFSEYRGRFTGGLRRLADGVAFANGYQAHGSTFTCPGHSTILTGSHPARTGVIANSWFDFAAPREDKEIHCAEDERAPATSSQNHVVSAAHLRVPTLGDRLKQARPASRVISVAGKDRAAAMMGGHTPDHSLWWRAGAFIQSNSSAPAPGLTQVNTTVGAAIGRARAPLAPPAFCAAKDKAIDVGSRSVGRFRFQRTAGDAEAFAQGPELDAAVLTLAAVLVQQMRLGQRGAVDLLAIGLSATDLVGERYGPGGLEMCLQLMSLDSDLGAFFAVLDRSGVDYAVALTADHGSIDLPERERARGVKDAARVDSNAEPASIGAEVARRLGLTGPVFMGGWYIGPAVPAGRRQEVLVLAKQLLARHPQVHSVHMKAELAAHPMPQGRPESWTVSDRLRASFDAGRSGDLAVVYKPNIGATHGSVWDYDRKVPILFWWPGIVAQDRSDSAMTVDILPTLASLIGLAVPAPEIDGQCLDLLPGDATNCR